MAIFFSTGLKKKLLMSFYVVLDPAVTLTRVSLVRWRGCINLINTGNSRNLLTDLHSVSMQWSFWIPELLMGDIKFYYLQPGEWSTKHWSSPFHVTHANYPIHCKGTRWEGLGKRQCCDPDSVNFLVLIVNGSPFIYLHAKLQYTLYVI